MNKTYKIIVNCFCFQYESCLLQIKTQHEQELIDRDNEIKELREKLFQTFDVQAE